MLLQTHCCVPCAGADRLLPTGVVGQELLWRDASLGGSSGKCQDGVNSASRVNGECRNGTCMSDQLG